MKMLGMVLAGLIINGLLLKAEGGFAAGASNARTVAGGGVTVTVTYLDPKTSNDLRFQVVLDTHSVNLDGYDLKAIAVLRDDTGKSYLPTEVENKGSGHHREVMVIFPKVSSEAKRLEVVIKDVAGMKERTFNWDVQ
jgi:hypothetical protein